MDTASKDFDIEQQIDFLRKIAFFQGFDNHELKQFLQVSKWLRVPAKTMIIKENTSERAFYILVRGEVRVEKRDPAGGKPRPLTSLFAGDCFGEMALVSEIRRTADVVANSECFILRVEPEIVNTSNVFLQLKFYKRFCESLVARLDSANKLVAGNAVRAKSKEPPPPETQARAEASPKTGVPPQRSQPTIPPMPSRDARLSPNKLQQRIRPEALLPINPAVAAQMKALIDRGAEAVDTRRFAELILLDPILSCRLIQTANSPYFKRATVVSSVHHAMIIVGIKQVQEVMADVIAAAEEVRAFGGFAPVAESFWRHAVLVGRIAEMLKEVIRLNVSADLLLCGLFHDLGMLALDMISPRFYPQLARPVPEFADLNQAERDYIGCDHAQAGLWLGEGLGLPQPYLDVIRFHHQPEKARANHLLVALISLADGFAAMKKASMGRPEVSAETMLRSFAWVLLQEQHRPFLEVNIGQFIASFSEELDKTWQSLTEDLHF